MGMIVKFRSEEQIGRVMYSVDYLIDSYDNAFRNKLGVLNLDKDDVKKEMEKYVDIIDTLYLIKNSYCSFKEGSCEFEFEPCEFLKVYLFFNDEAKLKYPVNVKNGIELMREFMTFPSNFFETF